MVETCGHDVRFSLNDYTIEVACINSHKIRAIKVITVCKDCYVMCYDAGMILNNESKRKWLSGEVNIPFVWETGT